MRCGVGVASDGRHERGGRGGRILSTSSSRARRVTVSPRCASSLACSELYADAPEVSKLSPNGKKMVTLMMWVGLV